MKELLKYGMVGGGPGSFIADSHRRAMRIDGETQLVAGAFSRSFEKCRQTGEELGLDPERCYADFREMARAEAARPDGIDFVVIVTPNAAHYPAAKAFLEAGIPVVCDKPLCLTVEQGEELVRLSEEKGLLFMLTYTYFGHATVRYMKEYIESGKLGKIRNVMAEYPQGWLAYEGEWGGKQGEWRCDPKLSGGVNCLGDIGTHAENMVSMVTGLKIRRLLAKLDKLVPGRVLDDNDVVLLEYEGGAVGSYWISQCAIGHRNSLQIRIYGENGSLLWKQEESEELTIVDHDGNVSKVFRGPAPSASGASFARLPAGHTEGFYEAMANLYRSYTRCLRAKKEGTFTPDMVDFPTMKEGLDSVRFIHKALESQEGGNVWVEM